VGLKKDIVKIEGMIEELSPSLNEQVKKIVAPYQVRRAGEGELLACSLCGRPVSFTYRTVCGTCFLEGRVGRTS
jgi:hypothetical protein